MARWYLYLPGWTGLVTIISASVTMIDDEAGFGPGYALFLAGVAALVVGCIWTERRYRRHISHRTIQHFDTLADRRLNLGHVLAGWGACSIGAWFVYTLDLMPDHLPLALATLTAGPAAVAAYFGIRVDTALRAGRAAEELADIFELQLQFDTSGDVLALVDDPDDPLLEITDSLHHSHHVTRLKSRLGQPWSNLELAVRGSPLFRDDRGRPVDEDGDIRIAGPDAEEIADRLTDTDLPDRLKQLAEIADDLRIEAGLLDVEITDLFRADDPVAVVRMVVDLREQLDEI